LTFVNKHGAFCRTSYRGCNFAFYIIITRLYKYCRTARSEHPRFDQSSNSMIW